jgi:hypothetical protein
MDNPSLILETLDKHLDHEVQLVLYGRAALWLGFNEPPPDTARTLDVDAIISTAQEIELSTDSRFWDAIESSNTELAARGLYLTHLFSEREIFLRQQWQQVLVTLTRPALRWLRLFRLATLDLVLTKMMRGDDPQDMADAEFLIRHDHISEAQLLEGFAQMKAIKLSELREAFAKAKPIVLRFASEI